MATLLVVACCGVFFGRLFVTSISLDRQRASLLAVLHEVGPDDPVIDEFLAAGTMTIDGRTYGDEDLQLVADQFVNVETRRIRAIVPLIETFLSDQKPQWAPTFLLERAELTLTLGLIALAWFLLLVWIDLSLPFVLTVLGTGSSYMVCHALGLDQLKIALLGIGLLSFTYVLLTRCALLVLTLPGHVWAVAHTVVKESSRLKLSLFFVVLFLVLLPLIPMTLDGDIPLRYRIQTFISRSMGLSYTMAACLTLFLACATVAYEIRDRQIWQVLTKPVARFNYLLGKLVGVLMVDLILLTVASTSIFFFIQHMRELPVENGVVGMLDRQAINQDILVARESVKPQYDHLTGEQIRARVDAVIDADPELAEQKPVPSKVREQLAKRIVQDYMALQRRLAPMIPSREYLFEGMSRARDSDAPLTLRFRFHIGAEDTHQQFPMLFRFNNRDDLVIQSRYVPTMAHVESLPPSLIRGDGSIAVQMLNPLQQDQRTLVRSTVNFEEDDFQIRYKVGSFEANFIRAVMAMGLKLVFLGALGIAGATFLSFPVAVLLSFTIFLAGSLGPYLASSLSLYVPPEMSSLDWSNIGEVIKWAWMSCIRLVAIVLTELLGAFGEIDPRSSLVQGQSIRWEDVFAQTARIALVWTGLAMMTGFLVFRKREIATYSGQG